MASQQQPRRQEETPAEAQSDINDQQQNGTQEESPAPAPAAAQSDNNQQSQQAGAPPYAYQDQPLEEHESGDCAPHPQSKECGDSHEQQKVEQTGQKLGTPAQMGAPSHPNAHPDNKDAAIGNIDKAPSDHHSSTPLDDSSPTEKRSFKTDLTEFSKKMELIIGNLWGHLTTGSSVSDTAIGRMSVGSRFVTHRGFEGLFTESFPTESKDETLKKTYACFLSTATGPVSGTLFISNKRLAFLSDRALRYTSPPSAPSDPVHAPAENEGAKKKEHGSKGKDSDKDRYSFYKLAIPIDKIKHVEPSVNPKKSTEKYVDVVTEDNFDFWFMGFINYDKGVKTLQEVVNEDGPPPQVAQ